MRKIFTVSTKESGVRLDLVLKKRLERFSRHALVRAIKMESILVNGRPAKPKQLMRGGEKISVDMGRFEKSLRPDATFPLTILYEDNDLMAIDKPSGILAHPVRNCQETTIAHAVLARAPNIKTVGEDPLRPGIVHRLDKDTSGVMVIAKNHRTFEWMKKQFMERKVEKMYMAVVHGRLGPQKGTIEIPLVRIGPRHLPAKRQEKKKIRRAITHYRVLKYFENYTLVEVRPTTGRMHQIRSHFASMGHPIVGDRLYGKTKDATVAPRLMLHASEISFNMPDGRGLHFTSEPPGDFAEFFTRLSPSQHFEEPIITYE